MPAPSCLVDRAHRHPPAGNVCFRQGYACHNQDFTIHHEQLLLHFSITAYLSFLETKQ